MLLDVAEKIMIITSLPLFFDGVKEYNIVFLDIISEVPMVQKMTSPSWGQNDVYITSNDLSKIMTQTR